MVTMGLDLSMTGTGLVMLRSGTRVLTTRRIETLPETRKPKRAEGKLYNGTFYGSDEERIEHITHKCMLAWHHFSPEIVVIEGYSFGSKGSALSALHELGGVMKNKLLLEDAVYVVAPPSMIKSFATDNGNASKPMMVDAAREFWPECPTHDQADAFFAAKLGKVRYANLVEVL